VLLLLVTTLGCAGARPPEAEPDAAARAAGLDADLLADLRFRFTDPEAVGPVVYESTGPYRIVAVAEDTIELIGFDPLNLRPTYTTLLLDGERIWARVRIGERRFLTRVR
ncbi:MAG: hypothetical protein ACR2P8_08125, partial [Myxococcota bacterium]